MLRYHLKNTTPTDITAESSNVYVLDYMYYWTDWNVWKFGMRHTAVEIER